MDQALYLGKYRLHPGEDGQPLELARSATAITYAAEEIENGRRVALQLVPATSLWLAVRSQLEAEADHAKQLNHINLPVLYDFGIEGDYLIYATEFLEGTTLEAWIKVNGPMPVAAVLRVATQILGALGAAAFFHILHHAINPANILIVPGQTTEGGWPLVKLLNLVGVAPTFSGDDLGEIPANAAANFASPEQLRTGRVDFRSEIYSLGCTLWFLLTGAPPFDAPAESLGPRPMKMVLAMEKFEGVPRKARRLLAQMLSVNPEERPHDPLKLYQDFQECLAQVEQDSSAATKAIPAAALVPPRPKPEAKPLTVPVAAPATVPLAGAILAPVMPRRRFPAKTLMAVALMVLLASAGAFLVPKRFFPRQLSSLSIFTKQNRVVENPVLAREATPETAGAELPSSVSPQIADSAPVEASPPGNGDVAAANETKAAEPAQLISIAGANDEAAATAGKSASPSNVSREENVTVANETANPPEQTTSAPTPVERIGIENADAEPAVPSEGPPMAESAPAPPPIAAANFSSASPEMPTPETRPAIAVPETETERPREKALATKSAANARHAMPKRVAKTARRKNSAPAGTKRARVIGITRDGEWVLDVPSEGQGVMDMPRGKAPSESRKIPARAPGDVAPEALPVLPTPQ